MPIGAFNEYLDVAQVVLYVFWFFFLGLILYLRNEDRREGYPLEAEPRELIGATGRTARRRFVNARKPKRFHLANGEVMESGQPDRREVKAKPANGWIGSPLVPTGDPLADGVGPAAWAERSDTVDLDLHGNPKIVPLSTLEDFAVDPHDPNPVGMQVIGHDRKPAGTVTDAWVDRMEILIRYLEVDLGDRKVLLPINFASIDARRRRVNVWALQSHQFAGVPQVATPGCITLLEEDKITGYFGGGTLYATPRRADPWF